MHLPWLVLLLFFLFPLPYFPPRVWTFQVYVHWDCRRHQSASRFGLTFLTDFPNPSLPRVRVFKCLRRYVFVVSLSPRVSMRSMRTCRHHQPAQHPSAYLTVPMGLARLTTVFRRAIKALHQFPCYFPHIVAVAFTAASAARAAAVKASATIKDITKLLLCRSNNFKQDADDITHAGSGKFKQVSKQSTYPLSLFSLQAPAV